MAELLTVTQRNNCTLLAEWLSTHNDLLMNQGRFDLGFWFHEKAPGAPTCNTTACAAGWAATLDVFRVQGFTCDYDGPRLAFQTMLNATNMNELGVRYGTAAVHVLDAVRSGHALDYAEHALQAVFGMMKPFLPDWYAAAGRTITPEDVAAALRRMLAIDQIGWCDTTPQTLDARLTRLMQVKLIAPFAVTGPLEGGAHVDT